MKPITYGKEFFKKKFVADTMKKAYMDACKWYATNVLSKDELHNVQVEFEKERAEQQLPTITIHLFASLDETTLRERHCKICKEASAMFYSHHESNCIKCEANAYQRRTDDMLKVKIEYYRELIWKATKEVSE